MFLLSIRFKMVLWYMLLLALTLVCFSSAIYGSFNKLLYGNLDDLLSSRGEGVSDSVSAYWAAKQVEMQHEGSMRSDLAKAASGWVEEKRRNPELMSIFVRVLDRDGGLVAASKNMPRLESLDKNDMSDVLSGHEDFSTLSGETSDGKKVKFRVYSRPVMEAGEAEYVVQVAGPVRMIALASKNLFWALFILLPLTAVLAALPGLVLVRLTLKPVDEMIKTIRQTTAENLKLKIHLPDTKDEIGRLADTFNDMTERLDRSFSSQQSFIRDMSAELKAPLEAMSKELEGVKGAAAGESTRPVIERALAQLARFGRIIDELETLAKFDNSAVALEIRRLNLSSLLEKVISSVGADAGGKEIGVSSVLKEQIMIDGDEKQLRQLFANIIDNAIKYTSRKGFVTVSARKLRRSAVVTITDTGIGIDKSELPYVFDRFYQVKKSRISDGSFGLGLSIAKSVAEIHKGKIGVESAPGKGSTFTVSLPLSYPAG
jgi:signal transduction histidine kinase